MVKIAANTDTASANSYQTMTPQGIDPTLSYYLQRFARLDQETPTPQLDYVQRRRLLSELQARLLRTQPLSGVAVHNHFIATEGREIVVRSYMPAARASGKTLVWLHGGGWMVGSLDTHDDLCEHLTHYTGHTVVSVHYRRTPENPFPAPIEDVQTVLQWLHHMQGVLPFAHGHVLLGGDSAGGHLALATATQAALHPLPEQAQIQALLLLYPCLLPDLDTPSVTQFAEGYGLTRNAMLQYWQSLGGADHPLRTPSRCTQAWPALPPTVIMTASHDILRDEAEQFAKQLQSLPHGLQVRLQRAEGMVHGFARMLAASPAARQHVEAACALLQQLTQPNSHT